MKKDLDDLKIKLSSFSHPEKLSKNELEALKENTTVVFMAWGLSSRFSEVSKTQKSAFQLPNGESMIEMAIKMYAKKDLKNLQF